jgi:hypothetical protein
LRATNLACFDHNKFERVDQVIIVFFVCLASKSRQDLEFIAQVAPEVFDVAVEDPIGPIGDAQYRFLWSFSRIDHGLVAIIIDDAMDNMDSYTEYIRYSREFILGSKLRQSFPFKLFRHFRFRNRLIRVRVLGEANLLASASEVCLLGVWYEDYPQGMPLELLERDPKKWRLVAQNASPFGRALLTAQKGSVYVYSQHENLRLDFRMDENSGKLLVEAHGSRKVIDLYAPRPTVISIYPNHGQIDTLVENPAALADSSSTPLNGGPPALHKRVDYTAQDQQWLEAQSRDPKPVSVNNPDWRGILASAQELFENVYVLPDELDQERADYYARLFQEAGSPSITIQGFPHTYHHLVRAIRKHAPQIPVYAIYHGNFLHMREDYEWNVFRTILQLHSNGDLAKVGFVKKGMAEIMATVGVKSAFIMNIVRRIPDGPSAPRPDGVHVAIWSQTDWSWKKMPYAMLAALRLVPGAVGHAVNVSPRARDFGELLSLDADYLINGSIPQEKVPETLAQMHLNLYVSLSECAPMMPLESLSVGSPCLFGPTTHYFLDHGYLHSRLVVPSPDHAEAIAEKANLVLEERGQVIQAYREYAPGYNRRALEALADFLEFPANLD